MTNAYVIYGSAWFITRKKNEGIIKGIKFNALVVFAILVFFWGNPVMFFKQTAEMA